MPDTYTPNLGLTKPCTRKNWAEAVNENFEKLGVLHYVHSTGTMFFCKNATYEGETWHQTDTTKCSSLIQMGFDGSFTFLTCPAGSPTITSWTAVMTVTSAGAVTLASGVTINSSGTLTLPGNLSVAGTISGDITSLLLLSQMTISDKDWGGHKITNLGAPSSGGDSARFAEILEVYDQIIGYTSNTTRLKQLLTLNTYPATSSEYVIPALFGSVLNTVKFELRCDNGPYWTISPTVSLYLNDVLQHTMNVPPSTGVSEYVDLDIKYGDRLKITTGSVPYPGNHPVSVLYLCGVLDVTLNPI